MNNSNPIAMEPNKTKTPRESRYLFKSNNEKPKVIDLLKEPNALLDRYKRSITL